MFNGNARVLCNAAFYGAMPIVAVFLRTVAAAAGSCQQRVRLMAADKRAVVCAAAGAEEGSEFAI